MLNLNYYLTLGMLYLSDAVHAVNTTGTTATGSDGGDIFTKLQTMLGTYQGKIVGIGSAVAGLVLAISLILYIASKNEQKADRYFDWIKRALFGLIALQLINAILSTVQSLAGSGV